MHRLLRRALLLFVLLSVATPAARGQTTEALSYSTDAEASAAKAREDPKV